MVPKRRDEKAEALAWLSTPGACRRAWRALFIKVTDTVQDS